jgi:RES domain-containing protein
MDTAFAEYHQDIQRPGTACGFDVEIGPVLDLREGAALQALGATPAERLCPWKTIWLLQRMDPPTWRLADRLIAGGAAGILVPSAQRAGGTNLVLWCWNDHPGRKVTAFDPQGDLPRTQDPWA